MRPSFREHERAREVGWRDLRFRERKVSAFTAGFVCTCGLMFGLASGTSPPPVEYAVGTRP